MDLGALDLWSDVDGGTASGGLKMVDVSNDNGGNKTYFISKLSYLRGTLI